MLSADEAGPALRPAGDRSSLGSCEKPAEKGLFL